jgi:hypothetical protein
MEYGSISINQSQPRKQPQNQVITGAREFFAFIGVD